MKAEYRKPVDSRAKNWRDTQTDIAKMFVKYNIGDTRWTVLDSQEKAELSFAKDIAAKKDRLSGTASPAYRVMVQISIPIGPEGSQRNTAFRTLYWYLKSKLEAISFRFQDASEMLNFEREFFGHTVIEDKHGNPSTAFDAFRAGNVALAAPSNVIALAGGK